MMRKWMRSVMALCLTVALAGCGGSGSPSGSNGSAQGSGQGGQAASPAATVKIGFVMNLTGAGQVYGSDQKAGFELAVAEINKAGGVNGSQIEAIYRDPASDPKQAVTIFEELIKREKVVAIVGPTSSAEAFQADPLAVQAKVPVIPTSNNAAGIPQIGEYVHRFSIPEEDLLPGVAMQAVEVLKVKKVALMYSAEDPFAVTGYEAYKKAFEQLGVQIVATEVYKKTDVDFSSQLTKIKAVAPDAIAVAGYAEDGSNIVTQGRKLGIPENVRFMGNAGFGSPQLIQLAGKAAEGSLAGTVWSADDPDAENVNFMTNFKAKFNRDPGTFAAQAYNSVYFVAEGLKRAGKNESAALHQALLNAPTFKKLGSPITMKNRSGTGKAIVLEVRNGKFAIFK